MQIKLVLQHDKNVLDQFLISYHSSREFRVTIEIVQLNTRKTGLSLPYPVCQVKLNMRNVQQVQGKLL